MMHVMEIKRSPGARAVDADLNSWATSLSGVPPDKWWGYFAQQPGTNSIAPERIEVDRGRNIVFRCTQDQVGDWIKHIDAWIAGANREFAASLRSKEEDAIKRAQEGEERQRRMREANERFRDL
jgi:hypothetical protein